MTGDARMAERRSCNTAAWAKSGAAMARRRGWQTGCKGTELVEKRCCNGAGRKAVLRRHWCESCVAIRSCKNRKANGPNYSNGPNGFYPHCRPGIEVPTTVDAALHERAFASPRTARRLHECELPPACKTTPLTGARRKGSNRRSPFRRSSIARPRHPARSASWPPCSTRPPASAA